jgi:hypothetical protein
VRKIVRGPTKKNRQVPPLGGSLDHAARRCLTALPELTRMKCRTCLSNSPAVPRYSHDFDFARGAWLSCVCALMGGLLFPLGACKAPSSSGNGESVETESPGSAARLLLGATPAEARAGRAGSFVFENTPDLVLHAELRDGSYEGKTLLIQGRDPSGKIVWQYPHLQKGTSFDAVLPVFGSPAARNHVTGPYTFEVMGPDRTIVAAGSARFGSTRDGTGGVGASRAPLPGAVKE